MALKPLAKVGVALLVAAAVLWWGSAEWLSTRTFQALDAPITISEGQVTSPEFQINLSETYFLYIETDDVPPGSDGGCNPQASLLWYWRASRLEGWGQEKWKEWDNSGNQIGQGNYLGWIDAKHGIYAIDLRFLRGGECLNARHPRLKVSTSPRGYQEICGWLQWVWLLLAGTGVMLVSRAIWTWVQGTVIKRKTLRMVPDMELVHVPRFQKHKRGRVLGCFADIGPAWFGAVSALAAMFGCFLLQGPAVKGLPVLLFRPPLVKFESPATETLGVYVDAHDEYFVNGEHVERAKLREKLSEELGKRVVWTVYVEGDVSSTYRETVNAIDTIEGLGAKPIWITPEMRRERKEEGRE